MGYAAICLAILCIYLQAESIPARRYIPYGQGQQLSSGNGWGTPSRVPWYNQRKSPYQYGRSPSGYGRRSSPTPRPSYYGYGGYGRQSGKRPRPSMSPWKKTGGWNNYYQKNTGLGYGGKPSGWSNYSSGRGNGTRRGDIWNKGRRYGTKPGGRPTYYSPRPGAGNWQRPGGRPSYYQRKPGAGRRQRPSLRSDSYGGTTQVRPSSGGGSRRYSQNTGSRYGRKPGGWSNRYQRKNSGGRYGRKPGGRRPQTSLWNKPTPSPWGRSWSGRKAQDSYSYWGRKSTGNKYGSYRPSRPSGNSSQYNKYRRSPGGNNYYSSYGRRSPGQSNYWG